MPILEKLTQPSQARHWTDSIPLEFHYTAGVAGEQFRRELRDNGRFLVSKCSKCKSTYIPARMYCPSCFIEMKDQVPIDKPGYVYSFTSFYRRVRIPDRRGRDDNIHAEEQDRQGRASHTRRGRVASQTWGQGERMAESC